MLKFSMIRIFLQIQLWFTSYVQFHSDGHFSERAAAAWYSKKMDHLNMGVGPAVLKADWSRAGLLMDLLVTVYFYMKAWLPSSTSLLIQML